MFFSHLDLLTSLFYSCFLFLSFILSPHPIFGSNILSFFIFSKPCLSNKGSKKIQQFLFTEHLVDYLHYTNWTFVRKLPWCSKWSNFYLSVLFSFQISCWKEMRGNKLSKRERGRKIKRRRRSEIGTLFWNVSKLMTLRFVILASPEPQSNSSLIHTPSISLPHCLDLFQWVLVLFPWKLYVKFPENPSISFLPLSFRTLNYLDSQKGNPFLLE